MDPNLVFLSLVMVGVMHAGHAWAVHEEFYWSSAMPGTRMPGAIRNLLLQPDVSDEKTGAAVNVGGGGGVKVNTGAGTQVGVGPGGVHVSTDKGTNVDVGHGSVGVNVHHPSVGVGAHGNTRVSAGNGGGTHVDVGHGGVSISHRRGASPFGYAYEATETQLHDDSQKAFFFLEKDLHPGKKMKVDFGEVEIRAGFQRRGVVDSLGVDESTMPDVMKTFSVKPGTDEAAAMETTVKECSSPAAKGETKFCATSLESMVEFTKSTLATREITAMSTEATTAGGKVAGEKEYEITKVKRVPGTKLVACHAQPYPYAVFYCHSSGTTRAYKVRLASGMNEGAVVAAVVVCHEDTAGWNPKHLAFQVLKVKPGTVPVCHFLPQDHVVWAPRV